jgi:hypothetical protein
MRSKIILYELPVWLEFDKNLLDLRQNPYTGLLIVYADIFFERGYESHHRSWSTSCLGNQVKELLQFASTHQGKALPQSSDYSIFSEAEGRLDRQN